MSELKVGIHGLGWAAGAHIESFKEVDGATVAGASSRRARSEAELEETYGQPIKPYQSYEEMLADPDIDIIDICSPSQFHAEQAIQAAEAGKDLILEKPMALTYEDLLRLRDVVKANDVNVCVCFEVRYSEQGQALNSMIDQGMVGNVHYGEVDYYHGCGPWYGQYPWNIKKNGGGSSLLTAGCHALDLLLMYMDSEVEEVTSYSTGSDSEYFTPYEYDTTSVTILKFKNGSVGKVASVVDCLQPYYFHMHLVGSQGSILDNKFYSEKIEGLDKDQWSDLATPLVDSGDVAHHPYLPQFRAFIESLNEGESMPLTNFDSAFESHRVIFAADRSAAEGQPVELSEMKLEEA